MRERKSSPSRFCRRLNASISARISGALRLASRQGDGIERKIDAVDRLGEPRQGFGLALHDQQREEGDQGAENAGAKSDRHTQRTDEKCVADFDHQCFSGLEIDPHVGQRRNKAREESPALAGVREIDADGAAAEGLQCLLDRPFVEARQYPARGCSDRRRRFNSNCEGVRTRGAKHQRPLRAGRSLDQFNQRGDMARDRQGMVFGRMGPRDIIQRNGGDPRHAYSDDDDQCDPRREGHTQDHVSGLTWAVNR